MEVIPSEPTVTSAFEVIIQLPCVSMLRTHHTYLTFYSWKSFCLSYPISVRVKYFYMIAISFLDIVFVQTKDHYGPAAHQYLYMAIPPTATGMIYQ